MVYCVFWEYMVDVKTKVLLEMLCALMFQEKYA